MPDQEQVLTWGSLGLNAVFLIVGLLPKGISWLAQMIEGNRNVKVKENEDFKSFLMNQFTDLKAQILVLQKKLEDCEIKHAEAEKRVIATEAKLDMLSSQHNELLKQDKETTLVAKGMSVALKADPDLIKPPISRE